MSTERYDHTGTISAEGFGNNPLTALRSAEDNLAHAVAASGEQIYNHRLDRRLAGTVWTRSDMKGVLPVQLLGYNYLKGDLKEADHQILHYSSAEADMRFQAIILGTVRYYSGV